MAVPLSEQRILFQKSGNRCAFPDCWRLLTADGSPLDPPVVLGEIAHIVAESMDGPRGNSPLTPKERNRYDNLILLCHQHHQLIDDQPQTYSVERLHQMRSTHEERVEKALRQGVDGRLPVELPPQVTETVYSTLLPVEHMPRYIFGAPCEISDERLLRNRLRSLRDGEMAPVILHGGKLFAFQNLRDPENPFADIVRPQEVERYLCEDWWADPDRMRLFVYLTNRALNKLTGRRHLNYDRRHRRYFFQPEGPGIPLEIEYRPLNRHKESRSVVWQPKNKRTGEGRGYWFHRAVSLRFLRIGSSNWCLSIRPELHVTTNGVQPLKSEKIGSRVTKKKSRMFNYDLLSEVHFWRDFLSGSSPRIIMRFGPYPSQHFVVSTTLMSGNVRWPGIPEEHAKPFRNVEYVDDLFTWAEFAQLDTGESEESWEDADESSWESEGRQSDVSETEW